MKGTWTAIFCLMACMAAAQAKYDTIPNVPDHYLKMTEKFRKEPVTSGRTIFLGNSITEGGNWKKLLKDSTILNRGISGDNTFGVLKRLSEITRHKPARVYILIGVNDLSKNIPNEVVIENIFAIVSNIHAASPKTKIYVQSILPVNPEVKDFMTRFGKQSDIVEINNQLKKYAEPLKFTFVDIHSHFTDARQLLDVRFTNDGLHLNAAGYQHWVEYLKKNKYI